MIPRMEGVSFGVCHGPRRLGRYEDGTGVRRGMAPKCSYYSSEVSSAPFAHDSLLAENATRE